jgi:hypothetical protein
MNKKLWWIGAAALLQGFALHAQDVAGDWRGTLKAGPAELRLELHIAKSPGGLTATMDSIDQGAIGIPTEGIALDGKAFKFTVNKVQGTYEGVLSADGASIKGTWTQGQPLPLDFERGTFKKAEPKPGKPSDIDGAWSGTLSLGEKSLKIVYHILNTEEGLTATADIPDQGVKGLPITTVTRNGASLKFEMKGQAAIFDGKIAADLNTVTGTFSQMGNDIPLVLTRVKP